MSSLYNQKVKPNINAVMTNPNAVIGSIVDSYSCIDLINLL